MRASGCTWLSPLWKRGLAALLCAAAVVCVPHEGASWQRAHVGRVTHASLAGHRAYVATAQNVVACLTLRTGEIEWRQTLEHTDGIDDAVFASQSVITLSSAGQLLRAWDTTDGALLWEETTYSCARASSSRDSATDSAKPAALLVARNSREALVTLARGHVQLRTAADGRLLWDVNVLAHAPATNFSTLALSDDGTMLFVVGLGGHGSFTSVALELATGHVVSQGTAASPHQLRQPCVVASAVPSDASSFGHSVVMASDPSGERLAYVDVATLAHGQAETAQSLRAASGAGSLLPESSHGLAGESLHLRSIGAGLVTLEAPSGAVVALLRAAHNDVTNVNGPLLLVHWPTGAFAVSSVRYGDTAASEHVAAVARSSAADSNTSLQVLDLQSGRVVHNEDFPAPLFPSNSKPTAVFLGGYARRNGGRGFRVVVTNDDDTLMLLQQGQAVWTRQEALADITDALVVEPAEPSSGASSSFVALTACGKVLCLSSDHGDVVWTWWPLTSVPASRTMLLWRTGPSPLVLLAGPTHDGSGTQLAWLDARSGALHGTAVLPLRAARAMPLAAHDAEGRRLILFWEQATGQVSVFPDTAAAKAAVEAMSSQLFLHAVDGVEGGATGYMVTRSDGGNLHAVPAWSVVLHSPVVTSAARPAGDVVFSRTRVRGDRSTVYKYLNPNTLLLVTAAPSDKLHNAAGLDVFILDTVTGRVLYRVRHSAASGPVAATAADNWFVYAYWSEAAQRTEVSVLELFEDNTARGSSSLGAALTSALASSTGGGASSKDKASSLAPPTLRVLGQTYSLGAQIAALGVTVTRRGLTSRHVLLATRTGRIVALDRRFVDPRRPTRPSAADREEGLVPYAEGLPLLPGAHLTGAARAARIRTVLTAPAALESACHVLGYGLDVFYARTAPSQTFDTLGGRFSRTLLAATLSALAIGAAAAGWAVRRDDLARRWL